MISLNYWTQKIKKILIFSCYFSVIRPYFLHFLPISAGSRAHLQKKTKKIEKMLSRNKRLY